METWLFLWDGTKVCQMRLEWYNGPCSTWDLFLWQLDTTELWLVFVINQTEKFIIKYILNSICQCCHGLLVHFLQAVNRQSRTGSLLRMHDQHDGQDILRQQKADNRYLAKGYPDKFTNPLQKRPVTLKWKCRPFCSVRILIGLYSWLLASIG